MAVTPSLHVPGFVNEISRGLISGWAWNHKHPEQSVEIDILVDGQRYARILANAHRPRLVERLRLPSESQEFCDSVTGNYGFDFQFEPSLSVFRDYTIEVVIVPDGIGIPPGKKLLRKMPDEPIALRPIIVTSAGRSGSTLLMSTLAAHPQIIAAEVYPMEVRLLAYYAVAFRTLVSNANKEKSMAPDEFFSEKGRYLVGFNPYNRPALHRQIVKKAEALESVFDQFIPVTLRKAFRDIISSYYDAIRKDRGKIRATYFAEKGDLDSAAREAPRAFFGEVREILLVRDPRDLICSSKSFWKLNSKRAVDEAVQASASLLRIATEGRDDVLVLKYEDLVADAAAAKARLWVFLGLTDVPPAEPGSTDALFRTHGTSADPASSIGRWKKDLSREERTACEKKCKDFMRHFDYGK